LIGSGAWTDAVLALIEMELRNGRFAGSPMTRASGTARYRARASFPNGSINRSNPVTKICRWRFGARSSTPTHGCAVEQDQRSYRAARRERALPTGLLR